MFRNTPSTVDPITGKAVLPALPRRARRPWRRAITLTEVLISLGILTIGLLGVAALFPVGSFYMQRGEIADHGSALAQAAFHESIARGVLNPQNWLVWEDSEGVPNVDRPNWAEAFTFGRPFAEMLGKMKASRASDPDVAARQRDIAREFGSVFVIDPMSIASVNFGTSSNWYRSDDLDMKLAGRFPAAGLPLDSGYNSPQSPQWQPWLDNNNSNLSWPIRRVTLPGPDHWSLNEIVANRRFSSTDDLAIDLSEQQDQPAIQRWELASLDNDSVVNDPLTRQWQGDYSWFVTVVPNTPEARDALATDPSAHYYEVSVVVFYKRGLPAAAQDQVDINDNVEYLQANERTVRARIVSTGLSGGEVLLERFNWGNSSMQGMEPESSPYDNLQTGQWVMLCGPHPSSADTRPMMTARWYRVLSIEDEVDGSLITDATTQRLVALRGPQWPWTPADNLGDQGELTNNLYLCIPSGAVAVHSRTIRLEGNSLWSAGVGGVGAGASPDGTTYGW